MAAATISTQGTILDRLIDNDSESDFHLKRTISLDELKLSVVNELQRLLNTRVGLSLDALKKRHRSVIDYGIPDFSNYFPDSSNSRKELEQHLVEVISVYEPRLIDIQIKIEKFLKDQGKPMLEILVSALLVVEPICEKVSFILTADQNSAELL